MCAEIKEAVLAVMLETCIWMVSELNFNQNTYRFLCGFPLSYQTYSRMVAQLGLDH